MKDIENFKTYKGERMLKKAESKEYFWPFKEAVTGEKIQLMLLDNVQFIYELALAQLELEALGVKFEITNSLREFKLLDTQNIKALKRRSAYFKIVKGEYTDYFKIIQKNQTRSVNQYLTHWIYPYKGKFHPQMIRALLNYIGLKKHDKVLDPFIGSGTTAVEAQLLGIRCLGIDASPLCVLQSKVKAESIDVVLKIEKYKEKIFKGVRPLFNPSGHSLSKIISSIPDEKVRNFYKLGELVAYSDVARRGKELNKSFIKNIELMIGSVKDYKDIINELKLDLGKVDIKVGDARKLPYHKESIDGIITSPPYSIALDYVSNDAHALATFGFNLPDLREQFVGVRGKGNNKIELYNEDMRKSYKEMYRVLKKGKYCVIVIGNATYQGQEIKTVEFTISYCQKIGFQLVKNIDKIIFGLYNIMQKEKILIFKK